LGGEKREVGGGEKDQLFFSREENVLLKEHATHQPGEESVPFQGKALVSGKRKCK